MSQKAGPLVFLFVAAVLTLLAIVHLGISYWTAAKFAEASSYADPASELVDRVQDSLELYAIVEFQSTGEAKYRNLYNEQVQNINASLAELDRRSRPFDPTVAERLADARSAFDPWHRFVEENNLLSLRLPVREFGQLLVENDFLRENAHGQISKVNEAIVAWRRGQRAEVARVIKLADGLSVLLAALAFAVMYFVRNVLRQLNETATFLGQAVRVRDEVLNVVSHDLRSPLANIQLTARLLSDPTLSEEKRRSFVLIVERASERINRLIEDLLLVDRVREGRAIALDLHAENPASILDEACKAFSLQAGTKSITIHCDKAGTLPDVTADRHRILQVLSNLLDNAIKFTPQGGSITLSCEAVDGSVRFMVKDTGKGIEAEQVRRIFDLFWQAKPPAHMGAGLGLAIAKSIVERHGGKIWVDSKAGSGTTFFFTLPEARMHGQETTHLKRTG